MQTRVLLSGPRVDEVFDDLEVARVAGEERDAVDVGGRRDGEIDRAAARLSTPSRDCRGESTPLPRDRGIDRQCVEGRLHDAETLPSPGTLVGVLGDEDAEVQFGEGRAADGRLE